MSDFIEIELSKDEVELLIRLFRVQIDAAENEIRRVKQELRDKTRKLSVSIEERHRLEDQIEDLKGEKGDE